MRYLKNLIPPEHKVLPAYFQEPSTDKTTSKAKSSPLFTLLSIVLFFCAAICYDRPFIAFLLVLAGWLYTTKGKNWLQKRFSFQLTDKIRMGFHGALLVLSLPLLIYYQTSEAKVAKAKHQAQQKREKFTADSLMADQLRKDSLDYFIKKIKQEDPQESFALLQTVENYVITKQDIDTVKRLRKSISRRFAKSLVRQGKSKEALVIYNGLLDEHPEDPDLLYDRASYYLAAGKIKLAVADLNTAKEAGSALAVKLYNKVNPIRRRVAYYVTRCCDGTTSSATGRGACSWHGGVCNWNDPVYEEYRKY